MKTLKTLLVSALLCFSSWVMAAVNVNTASVEELEKLNGIGRVKASAIVAYRTEHGPFMQLEDLLKVKGIGQATLDKIADELEFDAKAGKAEINKKAKAKQGEANAEVPDAKTTEEALPEAADEGKGKKSEKKKQ